MTNQFGIELKDWIKDARSAVRKGTCTSIAAANGLESLTGRRWTTCYNAVVSYPSTRMYSIGSRLDWFKTAKIMGDIDTKHDIRQGLKMN